MHSILNASFGATETAPLEQAVLLECIENCLKASLSQKSCSCHGLYIFLLSLVRIESSDVPDPPHLIFEVASQVLSSEVTADQDKVELSVLHRWLLAFAFKA